MTTNQLTVEWGDCDAAGIAFYPNFFYWFDCSFQKLLRGHGLSQRALRERFGAVTPLVDVGAQFRAPVRCDQDIAVEATVTEWRERRFKVGYVVRAQGEVAAEGFELRAWALLGEDGRIKGAPIPDEFRRLLA